MSWQQSANSCELSLLHLFLAIQTFISTFLADDADFVVDCTAYFVGHLSIPYSTDYVWVTFVITLNKTYGSWYF